MKLIIHHHALVYQDEFGYWFPSFIGAWLNEISNQFLEVAFIGEMTDNKLENQDFLVNKTNFKILSIGIRGVNTSSQKKEKIVQLGKEFASQYSHLIIRGITPRQYQVFKAFKKLPSYFLMVGSLIESKPKFSFNYIAILVWFLYYIRRFQLRKISKNSKVFANSPQVISEFKETMQIDAEFVPTNTLQNSHFKEFAFRGFQNIPDLLFCGRVVKDKGIEELILAIGKLKRAGKIFKLHIVGSITNSYKQYLVNLITQEGIKEYVFFEGFKKFGDELLSFFRLADIYILPSYHEGFPHSIWEASSTSTPIITTKVGGIPGLVSEKEVIFTEAKSVNSLVNSIERLIADPDNAKKVSQAAFNLAQNYSIENCVQILKCKIFQLK
jgi:glycosyltransferase involved in cell wall biosynthesis